MSEDTKTTAAVLFALGEPLRVMPIGIPELLSGQVLVDIAFSGVCGTQLLEARGKRGPDRFLPHALGHEGTGTVLEVGPDVAKVKAGDRVVMSWIKGSGADVPSTMYESADGQVNSSAITTFMKRTVTCENRVTVIPQDMPLREAAMLGCAIPTGVGLVLNTAKIRPGNSVAVFGAGGVGLSAVLGASLMNASIIVAVDIFDHKLEQARDLGATHLVNARTEDFVESIRGITGGLGVDYAIEAVGLPGTMETAFRSVRDQGGLCIITGNVPFGESISIDPYDLIKGKQIVGSWGGDAYPDRDIPTYVDLYLSKKLDLGKLITHIYSLENINQALDDLEQGKTGRGLIDMSLS